MKIYALIAILGTMILAGCQAPSTSFPSESRYTPQETMRSASVDRCRVIDARRVWIGAETPGNRSGYFGSPSQPEEQIGTLLGTALGAALGSQIGGNNTAALAIGATLGGTLGRSQGSRMAAERMKRPGIEYSILMANGQERVIVQHENPGDRMVYAGQACRVTSSAAGQRVLPADHLPVSVARPRETRFH